MNLYQILVNSANAALPLQNCQAGFMPPGHNGSYHDPETPVRSTAHWLITFLKAYDISGERKFLEAAHSAVDYLRSDDVRPMGATFWHRKNPKKDSCNGLIGQAWTIEALVTAGLRLEMPELISLAEQVFFLHPHDAPTGLWQRVGVDGAHLDFDYAFNHQLWFAAAGGMLSQSTQSNDIKSRVNRFLDCLPKNLQVHSNGLIRHSISLQLFPIRQRADRVADDAVAQMWKVIYWKGIAGNKRYSRQKEIGYHSFNLYAFALLKQIYPTHSFWQNSVLLSALRYARSQDYQTSIQDNKYGYPYNPPGFEIPFVLATFDNSDTSEQQSQWVSEQLLMCYDFDTNLMTRGTEDKNTHSARLYEATRLSNLPLSIQTKKLKEISEV